MAETKLDIILRMRDEMSANMKRASANVEDLGRSIERNAKQISAASSRLAFLGAGMTAPFILALKSVEKFSFGVQTELKRTENSWNQFNNTIAQAALPTVKEFNDVFAKVVNLFQSIDPKLLEQVAHWTLVSGAVLIAAAAFGKIFAAVEWLIGAFTMLIGGFLALNPVILAVIVAVTALAALWVTHADAFYKTVDAIEFGIRTAFKPLVDQIKVVIDAMGTLFSFLGKMVQFHPAFAGLKGQFDMIANAAKDAANKISGSGQTGSVSGALKNATASAQGLLAAFQNVSPQINTLVVDMTTRMHDLSNSIADGFGEAFDQVIFEGKTFSESLKNLFTQISRSMLKDFVSTSAKNFLNSAFFPGQQTQSGTGIGGGLAALFAGVPQQSQATATAMQGAATQTANMAATAQKGTPQLTGLFTSAQKVGSGMSALGGALMAASIGIALGQSIGGENGLAGQKGKWGMLGAVAGGLLGFAVGGPWGAVIGAGVGGLAGGMFHDGGTIGSPIYAHSGLAPDEIPIIAQSGEGVLNRGAMGRIGSDGLRKLNRGGNIGGGGNTIVLTQVIQAWDAADVQRNTKVLSASMVGELRTNGALRKAMRE